MDFGAAFSYMFKDPDWVKKLLIGAVLVIFSFLLVPGVFLAGYFVKATRNIASGEERPLPEWDNWGDLFVSGIKLIVVGLIYGIALGLLVLIVTSLLGPVGVLLALLVRIAYFVFGPVIVMRYLRDEEIADAFKFGEILELMQANSSDYIVLLLLSIVAGFIAGAGFIALIIGVFVTTVYSMFVIANLYGQYMKLYSGAAETKPVEAP